ncbi:unnamed protein product [Brassica oleracea]|uniref:(rape) hypothetical protein n=1 Tax=Brassica napus TaxID=3708 RepID=A0A816LDK9_BRANA|nr:unnamed protein product [Brassica napus]
MDLPELPKRMFALGEKPIPAISIAYYTDDPHLLPAVKAALHDDEWEALKNSRLGVFIKFWELKFGWGSRLVHYMLCYQLDIKKKYELWCLIGPEPVRFSLIEFEHLTGLNCEYIKNLDNPAVEVTDELARFWELMAVDIDAGPSSEQIVAACERCGQWSQDDRMRLGYLAIYTRFIEGKKYSSATRASPARLVMDLEDFETYPWGRLAFKTRIDSVKAKNLTKTCYTVDGFIQVLHVWVYYALPDLAASYGKPIRNKLSPPFLAYKGHKGRKFVKEAISTHVYLIIPNNIVLSENVNGDKGGRENNVHAANTEPGCLTEPSVVIMDKIKQTKSDLERKEERHVSKKDIIKEYCRAKSEREKKLAASQQSRFLGSGTAKQIVPTKNVGHGYDPFAPFDKKNAKVLLDFWKKDLHHTLRFEKKPCGSRSLWFATLRTPMKWLMGSHMDGFINLLRFRYSEHPEHFRSDRLCFLDSTFGLMWIDKYGEFKSSEPSINGLGRRLPPGPFDHYAGLIGGRLPEDVEKTCSEEDFQTTRRGLTEDVEKTCSKEDFQKT